MFITPLNPAPIPVSIYHGNFQVAERDAPLKPRTMEMPPLLKLVMAKNRAAKGDVTRESDLLLPAYKIYDGDVRLSDTPEPHSMTRFITEKYATYKGKIKIWISLQISITLW